MIKKYIKRHFRHRIKHIKLIFIVLIILMIFILVENIIHYNIVEASKYQTKIIVTETINKTIISQLSNISTDFDSLVDINKDNNGQIIAITTNIKNTNLIKSRLSQEITSSFNKIQVENFKIPLGTLMGIDYLAGYGPSINLQVTPIGYIDTNLKSEFIAAGINQTKHRIVLEINLNITTFVPLYKSTQNYKTDFLIAETIIVGNVPNYSAYPRIV